MNFAIVLEKRYENPRFAHFYTNSFVLFAKSYALICERFALIRESYAFIRAKISRYFAKVKREFAKNIFSPTKMSLMGFRTFY